MDELKEISNIAAKWWADVICDPKMNNGASDMGNIIANYFARQLVKTVTDEQKETFYNKLSGVIYDELNNKERMTLSVDYNPDMTLYNTGVACNIPETNFPIKTVMWVNINSVKVRYGYGANTEILYANKQFYLHEIKRYKDLMHDYIETDEYDFLDDKEKENCINECKSEIQKYEIELSKFE